MKKIVSAIIIATACLAATTATAQENLNQESRKEKRDAERARLKAEEEADQQQAYELAVQAIGEKQFVVEADQLQLRDGSNVFVNSTTNFLLVNVDKGTVQVAFNTALSGPNGIGGVTVDGSISDIRMRTDKHGTITLNFGIQGVGISAQIFLSMYQGNNEAYVTVSPNFNSNNLSMSGKLVPLSQSEIFKGNSF